MRIELQAVDDGEALAQPDMFRSQITVPVKDEAAMYPLREHGGPLPQETALHVDNTRNGAAGQVECRVEQTSQIRKNCFLQGHRVALRIDHDPARMRIETAQQTGQSIDLGLGDLA